MSSSDSLTPKTHPWNQTACRYLSYNQSYSPSNANANYSKLRPKICCYGNVPQHLWTPIQHMIPTARPSPQPKQHSYRFSRVCTDNRRVSLYFTMGRLFSPKNLPLPMGRSGPPSNTWFPGPTQVLNPNGSSIGTAVFAGLTSVTDRQTDRPTDHATRSVRIGRIYVRNTAMRPNNVS